MRALESFITSLFSPSSVSFNPFVPNEGVGIFAIMWVQSILARFNPFVPNEGVGIFKGTVKFAIKNPFQSFCAE